MTISKPALTVKFIGFTFNIIFYLFFVLYPILDYL